MMRPSTGLRRDGRVALEINRSIVTRGRLLALDAKMTIDDNAL
jgi:succinyl-CoA synthetase beta subunit